MSRKAGLSKQAYEPLKEGEEIRLAAFPPAELIAEGAAPLAVAATVTISLASDLIPAAVSIVAEKALPNVTGPLLDSCGNFIGFSSQQISFPNRIFAAQAKLTRPYCRNVRCN